MKRILGITMVLGLVGALSVMAQEVKPGNVDVVDFGEDVKLEMVLIPAGKFKMGFTKKELEDLKVEFQEERKKYLKKELGKEDLDFVDLIIIKQGKQHEVTLTKSYYMGKHEVTQEQWEAVMGKNPSEEKGAKLPVTDVSWEDCQEFIKKLNKKTDGGYRLPTESEWEYACRAGTTTAYSFGDKITPKDANYRDSELVGKPVAVGSYKPNAFGLYDMHGNAFELCEDWDADYPAGAVTDPKGPATGEYRVGRGGCFYHNVSDARSSRRNDYSPYNRYGGGGFRLARTIDLKAWKEEEAKAKVKKEAEEAKAKVKKAKAKEAQKKAAMSLQKKVEEKEDLGKDVKLDLVLIPAGKFMMGSPASEKDRSDNETQHEVTLTKPFYMGKYEVTQEQWEAVMGNNPSEVKGAKLPVIDVSWEDCQEFIKKLNAKTSGGYRLPTEAEWEYACRAGTSTAYSFGDKITPKNANYPDSRIGKPVAVGSYKANTFGLYDMHGNLLEWCEDWYGDYPAGALTDPRGPATGKYHVLRGGCFSLFNCRSSNRNYAGAPGIQFNHIVGFRLARTP